MCAIMTVMIKRNGRRERFDPAKLRKAIAAAANEAGLPVDRCEALVDELTDEVAREVLAKGEVRAVELRERILARLDRAEPRLARAWRDYDREAKGLA
jgi:transcriptional repressor NrdR